MTLAEMMMYRGANTQPSPLPTAQSGSSPITPEIVQQLYRTYLGRDAMEHEIQGHLNNPGGVSGLTDTIMNSPEGLALRERTTAPTGSSGWAAQAGQAGQPSPGMFGQKPNTPQGGPVGAIAAGAQSVASKFFGRPAQSTGPWGLKPSLIQAGTVGGSAENPWARVGSAISTASRRISGSPNTPQQSGYAKTTQGAAEPASYDEWLNARERGW